MSRSTEPYVPAGLWRRLLAATTLAALLIAGPLLVTALLGSPVPDVESLREAWRTGRLDDHAVVQVGALLFLALWAWFLLTAVAEVWQVLRWRRAPRRRPLPTITPSPTGWVKHLVRVALVSSTAIVASGLAPLHARTAPAHAAGRFAAGASGSPAAAAVASGPAAWSPTSPPAAATILAGSRDTPYSVAARLGDARLRDRIIELNTGRPGPDGEPWSGGVFPAGMEVVLPDDALARAPLGDDTPWTSYTVRDGDSVYAIAARTAGPDHRRVTEVADRIIRRNLGRTMVDGRVFDDASLIVSGWELDVPAAVMPDVGGHLVVEGDSYWRIAEARLAATARSTEPPMVASLVDDLRGLNAPLLGHDDPNLILPGELVRWSDDLVGLPPVVVDAPAALEPVVVDLPSAFEPVVVDLPSAFEPVVVDVPPRAPLPRSPLPRPETGDPVEVAPRPVTEPLAPAAPTGPAAGSDAAGTGAPTARPASPAPATDRGGIPAPLGLGAAAFVCVGAVAVLESRRREQLRRSTVRTIALRPTPEQASTETVLRSCSAAERIARLELGLRAVAHPLATAGRYVVAALVAGDGAVELRLDPDGPPALPEAPWTPGRHGASWHLDATVALGELAAAARRSAQPCPAMVHVGQVCGGPGDGSDLYLDLEALGLLEVRGPTDVVGDVVRALTAGVAVSPVSETLRAVTVGIDPAAHLGNGNVEPAADLDAALDLAATCLGSTALLAAGRRTFALRARGAEPDAESWEPVVVLAAPCTGAGAGDGIGDVVELTRHGGRGLAVVLGVPSDGPTAGGAALSWSMSGTWRVDPLDLDVRPVGLDVERLHEVHDLLDAAAVPLPVGALVERPSTSRATLASGGSPPARRTWSLLVRLFGRVEVAAPDGTVVAFGRSKSLELAAWLALHRDRPTRTAARTALWELDVRAETFANVVSDARRAMARCVPPPEEGEWIERTLSEHLPLHPLVTTDADLVRDALDRSHEVEDDAERADVLRPAVELVGGAPFAGTDYLWPHAEGLTSALLLLATSATTELARCHLRLGDVDGVFWATGRGLQVVPGHEELISLRMRAHAQRGDLAGVRSEWEVYERALHADPWSAAEPSPKLAAVRRELLSS